jgi:hypothetical protein
MTTVQLLVAGKRPSKLVAKKAADRPPYSGRSKPQAHAAVEAD